MFLKIKIKAPPIEGKANLELIRFLSKTLGLPQNQITIEKGELSRKKKVHIEGLNCQSVRFALSL